MNDETYLEPGIYKIDATIVENVYYHPRVFVLISGKWYLQKFHLEDNGFNNPYMTSPYIYVLFEDEELIALFDKMVYTNAKG